MVKSEIKKAPVAFTTKTGQTVSFGSNSGKSQKGKKLRILETRIKVIEKSLAAQVKQALKEQAKASKLAEKEALRISKASQSKVVQSVQQKDKPRVVKKEVVGKSKKMFESTEDD